MSFGYKLIHLLLAFMHLTLTAHVFVCMTSWMIGLRPSCDITDQLAHKTAFRFCLHALYWYLNKGQEYIKIYHCQTKNENFWGREQPIPHTFSPAPSLASFGASILAPLTLGVPVPFQLRLEH